MNKKLDFNKIPDYTEEYGIIMQSNTDRLIDMGIKEWKKKRKSGVAVMMSAIEQEEMLRKLEEGMVDG